MKYYKVIRNKKIIDVLDTLTYVKYQLKHEVMLLCDEDEAEGILSSDKHTAYHIANLNSFPTDDFLTVSIEEITKHEYENLKVKHCMSAEEIIDNYTASLLELGVI